MARASFHNATFSDRIWMHQDLLKGELNKALQQALISGASMERLARNIRNAFGVSTKNAQRLMRTEIRRMQTDVAMESYKRNGNEEYKYMALGRRPCEACRELDGNVYNVKKMEVGLNAPPMHPNCMCSTAPHVDEAEYQAWLNWIDSGKTTEQWNNLTPTMKERMIARERRRIEEENRPLNFDDFDITEGGKFEQIKETDKSKYLERMRSEIEAQYVSPDNANGVRLAEERIINDPRTGYIAAPKGYQVINNYLRFGTAFPKGYADKFQQTIKVLKRITRSNELKSNYIGIRKVTVDYLRDQMGIDIYGLTKNQQCKTAQGGLRRTVVPKDEISARKIAEEINKKIATDGIIVPDNAPTSVSLSDGLNFFTHYPVKIELQMPKGTKGYITSNLSESEFIAMNGSRIEFIGAKVYNDGEKNCIKLYARLKQ